jgi:hypothetical protein
LKLASEYFRNIRRSGLGIAALKKKNKYGGFPMTRSHFDFPSRISARAIVAGTVSSLALMVLFTALGGALGLWHFDLAEMPDIGGGFLTFSLVAWAVSIFVSGFVAAFAGRAESVKEGALHGFVTWAAACIVGCGFLAIASGMVVGGGLAHASSTMLWGAFLGDLAALGAGIWGGMRGAKTGSKAISPAEIAGNQRSALPFQPALTITK